MAKTILIKKDNYIYPSSDDFFRPSTNYPEYCFQGSLSSEKNFVYEMVREAFHMMGMDNEHYGTEQWNPLGDIIEPGNKIVIKPNLVMDYNPSGDGGECLYTHPSVVAPVIDYALLALKGSGEIIIGDAPMQECDFDNLLKTSGYDRLMEYYADKMGSVNVSLIDFRDLKTEIVDGVYHQNICSETNGIEVHLGVESEFYGKDEDYYRRLRVTNYNPRIMLEHHNIQVNDYYVNKNILEADVIINMPKPKTHRKAGVTIALKNLVGINSRKEYLPHHTLGAENDGGDEYLNPNQFKKIKSFLLDKRNIAISEECYWKAKIYYFFIRAIGLLIKYTQKDIYQEGSWYGNDTISKTIADLNKIIFYADKLGEVKYKKQRKYLIIADMIVSGECEGPVMPSRKEVGMIALGDNPVFFDKVISKIMGADTERINSIVRAESVKGSLLLKDYTSEIILSNDRRWHNKTFETLKDDDIIPYIPAKGWEDVFRKLK